MEYFERAHVIKEKQRKGDETVKKQIKLMLHGYKTSDNKLIKEAENLKADQDDSTSVSGFSDLNITVSSIDDKLDDTDSPGQFSTEGNSETIEDVSQSDNLSEFEFDESASKDLLPSVDKSVSDSSHDDSSTEFDNDGKLASRIHNNLRACKIKQKRKSSEISSADGDVEIDEIFDREENIKHKNKKLCIQRESTCHASVVEEYSSNLPSEYVSITVKEVPKISFDDVIGEYKHSTVRNIPNDTHNDILSTSNTGIFSVECVTAQMQTEEDVGSLVPEVDDSLTISDLIDRNSGDTILDESESSTLDQEQSLPSFEHQESSNKVDEIAILSQETDANSFKVYFGNNSCVIIMKHPSNLYLNGKVLAKCLGGRIEVCGYTLRNGNCKIFAPYYSYAQCFRTVENTNNYNNLLNELTKEGVEVADANEIVTAINNCDGILLLKPMKSPKMEFVDNNFSITNIFKNNKSIEQVFEKASKLLDCTLYSIKPVRCFEENPHWKKVMKTALKKPKRGIICGGKGSGKSTFLRYSVNRLLEKGPVLVIDLDPGQSEFTVAGNISATVVHDPIFGPSFTHLKKPDMMLNIGVISTMDNTKCYVNAVQQLIRCCKNNEQYRSMPWIVNTMGMTNAVGLKFITIIITLIHPHYVLQYDSKNHKKNYATKLDPRNVMRLFNQFKRDRLFQNLPSQCLDYAFTFAPDANSLLTNQFSLAPRDERYLSFMAYFGQLCEGLTKSVNSWVFGITPYEIKIKDLYFAVNVNLKDDCITKVINGKVVALCQQSSHYENVKVFTFTDKPLVCHGHGLIKGTDWEKEVLYVVTPVSGNKLSLVNTLVYSDWIPDIRGQENYLPDGTVIPYRTTADHHQLIATPRRRFNPLQLIKMTRSS